MAFIDDILTILCSYSGGYKRMRQLLYGRYNYKSSDRKQDFKDTTFRATLFRLKKLGFVSSKQGKWGITLKGKIYLRNKKPRFTKNHGKYSESVTRREKTMIIAFDVPESYKRERDWLRVELRLLGFEPIQKSVWFGPRPLPRDFVETLSELHILRFLKFFRATEEEIV